MKRPRKPRPPAHLLSTTQAAAYVTNRWHCWVTPGTVRQWVRGGALPALEGAGGRLYVKASDLDYLFR